jgi:hypothetical protein
MVADDVFFLGDKRERNEVEGLLERLRASVGSRFANLA